MPFGGGSENSSRDTEPYLNQFFFGNDHRAYVESVACNGKLYAAVQGELCRDALIEFHLGIVGPIAGQIAWKRYPAKPFGDGHDDLVQELTALGNLGLFEAVDHFKPEAGRFSTIANFWIWKFIREGDRAHSIFGREGLVTPC